MILYDCVAMVQAPPRINIHRGGIEKYDYFCRGLQTIQDIRAELQVNGLGQSGSLLGGNEIEMSFLSHWSECTVYLVPRGTIFMSFSSFFGFLSRLPLHCHIFPPERIHLIHHSPLGSVGLWGPLGSFFGPMSPLVRNVIDVVS